MKKFRQKRAYHFVIQIKYVHLQTKHMHKKNGHND